MNSSCRTSSLFPLGLSFHCGKYSLLHLLQIISAYACDTLNTLRRSVYRWALGTNGVAGLAPFSRKWFGVKANKSSGSSLTLVNVLEFNICSTRHIVVYNISSANVLFPANIAFLQPPTMRSQTPPKCGAPECWTSIFFAFEPKTAQYLIDSKLLSILAFL